MLAVPFAAAFVAGCSASPSESQGSNALAASASSAPTLTFTADWQETASGEVVAGQTIAVHYDAARLPTCRADYSGHPGWSITGYVRIAGVDVASFPAAGVGLNNGPSSFVAPFAGDMEIWFESTDVSGCRAFDSRYGQNYHFGVVAPSNAPGWIGDAVSLVDRASCGSGGASAPCWNDAKAAGDAVYDTWARTRAAYALVAFEVWKQGVTDFANPDLWRQLDVELHSRVGDSAPFATTYVNFREYVGNNARYAIDLRAIDPLPGLNGGALTDRSQCPSFPVRLSADGQYVDADYQFYFTVNGVALQPPGGGVLHARFENYAGLYAVCGYSAPAN